MNVCCTSEDKRWRDSDATAHSGTSAPEDKHEHPSVARQGDAPLRSGLSWMTVNEMLKPLPILLMSFLRCPFALFL